MWRRPNRVLAALAVTVLLAAAGCSVTTPGVPVAASGGPHPAINRHQHHDRSNHHSEHAMTSRSVLGNGDVVDVLKDWQNCPR